MFLCMYINEYTCYPWLRPCNESCVYTESGFVSFYSFPIVLMIFTVKVIKVKVRNFSKDLTKPFVGPPQDETAICGPREGKC